MSLPVSDLILPDSTLIRKLGEGLNLTNQRLMMIAQVLLTHKESIEKQGQLLAIKDREIAGLRKRIAGLEIRVRRANVKEGEEGEGPEQSSEGPEGPQAEVTC